MNLTKNTRYESILLKSEIIKVIESKLDDTNFEIIDYEIKPASENPMGFLGEHIKFVTNVKHKDTKKSFQFFVKKIPTEVRSHYDYATDTKAFYKEVEIYKTLFQDFKNVQNQSKNRWHPICYYTRGVDIIVVEDLSIEGYKLLPERELLDRDHFIISLESMARMHAASIIFEEKYNAGEVGTVIETFVKPHDRVTIGEIYEHLTFETEASDIKGHPGNIYHEAGIKSEAHIIDLLEGYSSTEIEIIKTKLPDQLRKVFQFVKPSKKYKNVFLHGDLWANNIMFRYDEQGKVQHAMIIDFQLARYSPPAHDVIMLLYLNQSKDFREKHTEKLLQHYYEVFSSELKSHNLNSDKLITWEEFRESYDYYQEYATICCIFYYQIILIPSHIMGKYISTPEGYEKLLLIDRSEMVTECFLSDEVSRKRITEALNDLIKNYILV